MKTVKRILSLVVVVMIIAALAVIPVSAEEMVPYAAPSCGCGGRTNLVDTSYGIWITHHSGACSHVQNPNSNDVIQRRLVKRYYECKSCGDTLTSDTYEYRTICPNTGNTYY